MCIWHTVIFNMYDYLPNDGDDFEFSVLSNDYSLVVLNFTLIPRRIRERPPKFLIVYKICKNELLLDHQN